MLSRSVVVKRRCGGRRPAANRDPEREWPYVTNGNIYAPVMMLAEKAADMIAGNLPLVPEPVEFYRHRKAAVAAMLAANA